MSSFPNRCQHLKINGTQCGSPALRRNRFCYFHKRFQDEQIKLSADRARRGVATFILPVLEDANSIQIALMQVMRLLVSQRIDHKTASLLLYALQTASINLRLAKFDPWRNDVVLDERSVGESPLGAKIWNDSDFADDEEETDAGRAIRALETVRKKKADEAKWMRWAEAQYPNLKSANPSTVAAAANAEAAAKVAPADPPKKPATGLSTEKVREEISDMVRKELFPGCPVPAKSTSTG